MLFNADPSSHSKDEKEEYKEDPAKLSTSTDVDHVIKVTTKSIYNKEYYKEDPAKLPTSMDVDHVIKMRQELMSPTYAGFQTFKTPVVIERASGQYCYGPSGEKYIDLLASNLTISVGHAHPRVIEAAKAQIDKMPHISSMYYSEPASLLAEKLVGTLKQRSDGEKWQVLYAVTGTEAVELSLQVARTASGHIPVLSMQNSYHGSYGTAMAATGGEACKHNFPEAGGIFHVPAPIYDSKNDIDRLVREAENAILSSTDGKISCWIFEVLQGK